MKKWLAVWALLLLPGCACAQIVLAGPGDPRQQSPVPSCDQAKLYVDLNSGTLYSSSGKPCSWNVVTGSGTFTALTGDATSTSTGGSTQVVGLRGLPLPTLAAQTGYLHDNNGTLELATPAGTGDVNGPASSTTGNVATFADSTGKVIQDAGFKPAAALGNQVDESSNFSPACISSHYVSASVTATLPSSVSTGCVISFQVKSGSTLTISSGTVTYTGPTTVTGPWAFSIQTDGTNFNAVAQSSSAGIANIQITVGTTAVSANSCTLQTAQTMTGVATTSTFKFTPSTDVSAVTGWSAGTGGQLYFTSWPTANTLNYYVCNPTSASITPGASTIWNVSAQ